MSEWWTYTLSDFLLFSPRTYYRLLEIYNAAIWPAQILAVGLGLAIAGMTRASALDARRGRFIASILATCWLWVAIAFHANRYAMINWAAVYFAWGFGIEAALLTWKGVVRGQLRFERPRDLASRAGLGIFLFALLAEPLAAPLLGRGWRSAETFGGTPDPTAVATLGLLLLVNDRGRGLLSVLPAIWCAISGATLVAMKAPDFWVPPLAAALAIALGVWQTRERRRRAKTQAAPVRAC
jgi:hypothetical protein